MTDDAPSRSDGGVPPPALPPPPPPHAGRALRPRGTSGRTSIAVLGIIAGVLFGANLVDAALPLPEDPVVVDPGPDVPVGPAPAPEATPLPVEPGPVAAGEAVDVGHGFTVHPPSGWTSVGTEGAVVFQRSGVLLIVEATAWNESPADLATAYRDALFADGQLTGDDPQTGSLGDGIPAAGLDYTGTWQGSQVDGAIFAGVVDGDGLVINVVGSTGSPNAVSGDIDQFLATVRHAGG